jgi:hypothetical protein
MGVVRGR